MIPCTVDDDFGGWCWRRVADDWACALERLQFSRFCDAIFPLHCWSGNCTLSQGYILLHFSVWSDSLKAKDELALDWFFFSSMQRIPNRLLAVKKVVLRTLKLLFWGILLQGQYLTNIIHIHLFVDFYFILFYIYIFLGALYLSLNCCSCLNVHE